MRLVVRNSTLGKMTFKTQSDRQKGPSHGQSKERMFWTDESTCKVLSEVGGACRARETWKEADMTGVQREEETGQRGD